MSYSISNEFSLSELFESIFYQERFEGNEMLSIKRNVIRNICNKLSSQRALLDIPKQYYDWFKKQLEKWYFDYDIEEVYDLMLLLNESDDIKPMLEYYSEFNQGRRNGCMISNEEGVFVIPKARKEANELCIDDILPIEEWLSLGPQREAAVRRMLSSYKTGERTATRDMLGINQRGRFPSRKFDKAMEFKPKRNN